MTDKHDHLLLIDGLNIVRRVYEAIPVPDSHKKAEGAMKSSMISIQRALKEHSPSHALAVFDAEGKTWRHELFAAYHLNRKPKPEPLRKALPGLIEKIQASGIKVVQIEGVEADDVLAGVARKWAGLSRGPVTVLSTDKDLAALTAEGVQVYDHFKSEWHDAAWVEKKFGVKPAQLQDLLALTGDSTDGIAGLPGVGPKTAAKWLIEFGSLEKLLENSAGIKGKAAEALRGDSEQVRLARRLVDFKTDFSLGITWNMLKVNVKR